MSMLIEGKLWYTTVNIVFNMAGETVIGAFFVY